MTTGEDGEVLREKIARAIWEAQYPGGTSWDDWANYAAKNPEGFDGRDGSRKLADAVLALIEPVMEENGRVRKLAEILDHAPSLPKEYQWSGQAEALFDNGIRHRSGKKPFDYLKSWLSMLRPFAYATRDDSWGRNGKAALHRYAKLHACSRCR
jgi:hypothetical protein